MRLFIAIFFVLFSLSCIPANGQRAPSAGKPMEDPIIKMILRHQQGENAPKARGMAMTETLTGFVRSQYTDLGTLYRSDSTCYFYKSVQQPSYLDNNDPDTYTEVLYQGNPIQIWLSLHIQERPSVGFDSAYQVSLAGIADSSVHNISRTYIGKLLAHQYDSFINLAYGPYAVSRVDDYQFAYNPDSQILQAEYNIASTSDVSGTSFRIFSNGRLVRDSFVSPGPNPSVQAMRDVAYDPNGRLDTITIRNWGFGQAGRINNRESYAYTSGNRLLAHYHEGRNYYYDSLKLEYVDSFFYTGTRVNKVVSYSWNAVDSTWRAPSNRVFQYYSDASGKVDSLVEGTITAVFVPDKRTIYRYTQGGHFDEIVTFTKRFGTFNNYPSYHTKFYYKTDTPQVINRQPKGSGYVRVFPNPVADRAYVQLRQTPRTPVAALILNAAGQIMRNLVLKNATSEIVLDDLAAGTYFLTLTEEGNNYHLHFTKL